MVLDMFKKFDLLFSWHEVVSEYLLLYIQT